MASISATSLGQMHGLTILRSWSVTQYLMEDYACQPSFIFYAISAGAPNANPGQRGSSAVMLDIGKHGPACMIIISPSPSPQTQDPQQAFLVELEVLYYHVHDTNTAAVTHIPS